MMRNSPTGSVSVALLLVFGVSIASRADTDARAGGRSGDR